MRPRHSLRVPVRRHRAVQRLVRRVRRQGDRMHEGRHLLLRERRTEGDDPDEGRPLPADDRRAAQGRQGRRLPERAADVRRRRQLQREQGSRGKRKRRDREALRRRLRLCAEPGHARRRPAEGHRRRLHADVDHAARRRRTAPAISTSSTSPGRRISRATSASTATTTWASSTRTSTSASLRTPTSPRPCRAASPRRHFRKYYALRASSTVSRGAHDEWNIFRMINEKRRARQQVRHAGADPGAVRRPERCAAARRIGGVRRLCRQVHDAVSGIAG